MIKVTVILNGISTNIDRDLLPKDSIGREYDHIIDELDENGLYKIDEDYYAIKAKEDATKDIDDWFHTEVSMLNKKYTQYEVELFPTLESEARSYINDPSSTTPFLDYIVLNRSDNKYQSKLELSNIIIQKAEYRRETIMSILIEKKNKLYALN